MNNNVKKCENAKTPKITKNGTFWESPKSVKIDKNHAVVNTYCHDATLKTDARRFVGILYRCKYVQRVILRIRMRASGKF